MKFPSSHRLAKVSGRRRARTPPETRTSWSRPFIPPSPEIPWIIASVYPQRHDSRHPSKPGSPDRYIFARNRSKGDSNFPQNLKFFNLAKTRMISEKPHCVEARLPSIGSALGNHLFTMQPTVH